MKAKKYTLGMGKTYKEDYPYMQVSFYTRCNAMEICYGDIELENPNLAYSTCQSLLKVSINFL